MRLGKAGSDLEADAEALGRLISLILRLASPTSRMVRVQEIIGPLEMIGGAHSIHFGPARVRSLADDITRVLARYWNLSHRIRLWLCALLMPQKHTALSLRPSVGQISVRVAGEWLWSALRGACNTPSASLESVSLVSYGVIP